jgi:hypothetical protein
MALYTNKSATQGGGAPLSDATPLAGGTAAAGTSTSASRADHVHPDDVISRQTLGAPAQEITIAVDEADERIVIEGFGESDINGTCVVKFNTTTVDVTKIVSANGAAPSGSGTNPGASVADEAMGFTMTLDIRRTGTADRGGVVTWWISYGAASREYYLSGLGFKDSATAVTQILLTGSGAGFFATGFKVIVRRRKMS